MSAALLRTDAERRPGTLPFVADLDPARHLRPSRQVTLSKHYRIERLVGEGGMGRVYRAHDPLLERSVALKVIKPDLPGAARRRFVREARYGARLCHPNVVRVYDLGRLTTEGLDWFAMEYLVGRDLGDLLKRALRRDQRLPPRVVLTAFDRILDALTHAHGRGLVHRDVKPANVFVTREHDGHRFGIKLLDFGVALRIGVPEDAHDLCGDPRYCPPEQILGTQDIDARADVYACGISLFEALAGRHPFEEALGHTPLSLVQAHRELEVPSLSPALASTWPPAVICALDTLIRRATAKNAADRFPTADAMRTALRRVPSYLT